MLITILLCTALQTPAAPVDIREATPPAAETVRILPAPTSPRLFVLDLIDNGAGPDVTKAVSQALAQQAIKSHSGEVVTADQVRLAASAAMQAQLAGCVEDACMLDLGKMLEAERAMGGSVAKVGDDYLITLIVVSPASGSRETQVQRKVPAIEDMYFYATRQLAAKALTGSFDDPSVPVQITATQDGATVFVDGIEAGSAPLLVKLNPGQHEIIVRAPGVSPWKTVATVEEAAPLRLQAQLVAEALPLWPVTAIAATVAVVSYVGFAAAGVAAQDSFDGSFGVFFDEPGSYSTKGAINSVELEARQARTETFGLTANVLLGTAVVATVATAAVVVTDIIINGE